MQYVLPLLNMQAPAPPRSSKQQQLMRTVSISILVMSLPVLYVSFLHVPPAALFRDTTFWFLMSNSIIIVIAADSGMLFFGPSPSSSSRSVDADDGLSFVVPGGDPAAAENQAVLVAREDQDLAVAAENSDGDRAYALLVVSDDRGARAASEPVGRELMVVSQPPAPAELVAFRYADGDGATVPPASSGRPMLTASRSLAREERTTRRRRHGRRPSHSHALVPVQDKSVVVWEEKHLRRTATEGRRPSAEEEESEYSRLSNEELNRRVEEFIARFNREIRLQLVEEEQSAAA